MSMQGPSATDYANIASLNRHFLLLARDDPRARAGSAGRRLEGLSARDLERLAEAPFLLFALREHETDRWNRLFDDDDRVLDLVDAAAVPNLQCRTLAATAIAFLWHLGQRNRYALRVVTGAPLAWCHRLPSADFADLASAVGSCDDLLTLRAAENEDFWGKLLTSGCAAEGELRRAAHIGALHTLLTTQPGGTAWSAAACRVTTPAMSVADGGNRGR